MLWKVFGKKYSRIAIMIHAIDYLYYKDHSLINKINYSSLHDLIISEDFYYDSELSHWSNFCLWLDTMQMDK